MISSRMWAAALCLSPAALLGWGGCATHQPSLEESRVANSREVPEELFPPSELLVAPGTPDLEDIHLPSVMVSASIINEKGTMTRKACSGVIVHRQMVVSAAHCFCAPRSPTEGERPPPHEGGSAARPAGSSSTRGHGVTRAFALKNVSIKSIVDGKSICASTATVTSVQYSSPKSSPGSKPEIRDHTGEVAIHPAFELITGQRGQAQGVVWSNADLAVIFLETPLADGMPRLGLTDTEVQVGDAITLVGYSSGEDASPAYGVRSFGLNRVNRLIQLETGSSIFRAEERHLPDGAAASHTQSGDSGGACVKNGNGNLLVGVSTVGARTPSGGHMSIFTSVYSHRGWLLQMLDKAGKS